MGDVRPAVLIDLSDELVLLHAYRQTAQSTLKQQAVFSLSPLVSDLLQDLVTRNYRPERYRCFAMLEPKVREIFAPSFRDRLVHHVITEPLLPLLDRRLIEDSYAKSPSADANPRSQASQKQPTGCRHAHRIINITGFLQSVSQ